MSTKTSIKRIAAVAAVALTLGGFSAVSANAAANATFTVTGGTITANGTNAVSVAAVVGTYEAVTVALGTDTNNADFISSAGVGSINVPSIAASTQVPVKLATAGISATGATVFAATSATDVPGSSANALTGLSLGFSAYSAVAGTQTISVAGSSGTATLTITWGAAPVVTAQYSTAYMAPVAVALPVTSVNAASVVASSAVVNGAPAAVANITVTLNSAAATIIAGKPLTAVITGAGVVGIGDTNTAGVATGTNVSTTAAQIAANTSGIYTVTVYSSGVAGTATITLSSGTVALGTKTVTFYSAATKAVATQNLYVANKAGGLLGLAAAGADAAATSVATKYAYNVVVTDANGNAAAGATVKAVSSNTAVIQTSACVQSTTTPGTYNCDVTAAAGAVSGQSADVTFSILNATTAAYDILANPLTFKVGGAIASETLSTDSSSYSYLAPIKLSVNAKDSAGNTAYDQDATLVASLVSSVALSNPAGLVSPTHLINGVGSVTGFYAPATVGDFSITAVDNVSAAGEALSVTATAVGTSADASAQAAIDAAQEATDAANAAYDAANNAMDSADAATAAAQDASDNASAALAAVTSLSATVAKLVKSVAALATALTSIKKKLGVK